MNLKEMGEIYKIEYGPRLKRRVIFVCDRVSHDLNIQRREQVRVASQILIGKPVSSGGGELVFSAKRS